jgi:hypothetical protein
MSMRHHAASVAALVSFVWLTKIAAADCPPVAVPMGDPALVKSVSERLSANGVLTTAPENCPAVRVHLERRGDQLHLRVADGYQRRGEREVQDVATAAAIIESWTLQEIEAGSMPAESIAVAAPVPLAPSSPAFGIGAAFRSAVTEQSSTWMGATVSGCARIGWACVGATIGVAKDIEATGASSTDDHHLLQLDSRATAEVPRSLAGFVVSPGLSLGYGWQRISSTHLDTHMMPFTQIDSSHALRAGLQLRVGRAMSQRMSIFTELAADRSLARSGLTAGPHSWIGLSVGARFGSP